MELLVAAQAHYDRFGAFFEQNDFAGVRAMWDDGDVRPFYIAEEWPTLISSWDELQNYWEATSKINGRARLDWTVVSAKLLAPDIMLAMFTLDWMIHIAGQPVPYGGSNRGFGVLHHSPVGWRFVAHCEAPPAPISWVKAVYVEQGKRLDRPR